MKIFYTASYYGKRKYQKYYDKVLNILENSGNKVLSPEKGNYKNILTSELKKSLKKSELIHYESIRLGIMWADAVIIEASNEDFQLGYESSFAVHNKKPVLCLSIHQDFSSKIQNKYFHGIKYDTFSAQRKIETFLRTVQKGLLSERFNFFLSPSQIHHLDKIARQLDLSKAEVLRRLIRKDMSE